MEPILNQELIPDPLAHLAEDQRVRIHWGKHGSFRRRIAILAEVVDIERLRDSDPYGEGREVPVASSEVVGGRAEDEDRLCAVERMGLHPVCLVQGEHRRVKVAKDEALDVFSRKQSLRLGDRDVVQGRLEETKQAGNQQD